MSTNLHEPAEVSMTSLVKGIVEDSQELIKQQLTLFKVEIAEDTRKTREAMTSVVFGGATAYVGAILVGIALACLINWAIFGSKLPHDTPEYVLASMSWIGFAVVGLVLTGIGIALTFVGFQKFNTFNPLPDESVKALQENLEWTAKPK